MKLNKSTLQSGSILPLAMVMALVGLGIVYSYNGWLYNKQFQLNYRIAKVKALYNAESGMAERGYPNLFKSEFAGGTSVPGREISKEMGFYEDPSFFFYPNGNRVARVTGVHEIKNADGDIVPVKSTIELPAELQTLGVYMYLTQSEKAGGAPFVFNTGGTRRSVNFGSGDVLNGVIQTNDPDGLTVSDFGCPDFSDATVYLTNSVDVNLGSCGNYGGLFGGEIDTMSKPPVMLPPTGYAALKSNSTHIYDATLKINQSALKDTLIMTDIEFFDNRQFRVRQWWYLMPPHFTADVPIAAMSVGNPLYLEGADLNGNGLIDEPTECDNDGDLRTCVAYEDSLEAYRAITTTSSGADDLLNNYIRGPHGFSHFDFEPLGPTGQVNPNALLLDVFENGSENTVIYVKGGPVRVKGTYNGRYTVVTDEYTVYRRHATRYLFGGNDLVPRDTVWNNIWLMDDLINVDAFPSGNMANYQPGDDCEGGSDNIMGLVSGANIIVANTPQNGAYNQNQYGYVDNPSTDDRDIRINAGIVALNESFVIQYWQNTTAFRNPPYGDGRGIIKHNASNSGQTSQDHRGFLRLWGGVVQKYRGYMQRNSSGGGQYQVGAPGIGMTKDYNYDANLDCTPPPFYPAIEFDNGSNEVNIRLADYKKVRDN